MHSAPDLLLFLHRTIGVLLAFASYAHAWWLQIQCRNTSIFVHSYFSIRNLLFDIFFFWVFDFHFWFGNWIWKKKRFYRLLLLLPKTMKDMCALRSRQPFSDFFISIAIREQKMGWNKKYCKKVFSERVRNDAEWWRNPLILWFSTAQFILVPINKEMKQIDFDGCCIFMWNFDFWKYWSQKK